MSIFPIILGTAGHIDHGKSSLVKSLTGIDPDRLKEEKEREMTIDLGFAPFRLPDGREVGIIDVPGHEKFIKNMVAGATSIDFVLLVIAANEGVMLQTREHLEIMQILKIPKGLVVLTKADTVGPDLRELASEEIREFVHGTFLENAPIIPVSNITGEGLELLKRTICDNLAHIEPHNAEGVFRMPIQRIFSSHGYGTVITGVPVSGTIAAGDEIEIVPGGNRGRVKKIQAYGQEIAHAQAGHSTAINIKDIAYKDIVRGQVAAAPGYFEPAHFIEAKFNYVPRMDKNLDYLTPIRFYTGTLEEMGKLALLGAETLAPGQQSYVQIRLDNPVVTAPGDHFVVRLASPMITIGGGIIVGTGEKKLKRFRSGVLENLELKETSLGNVAAQVESCIAKAGLVPSKIEDIQKVVRQNLMELEAILDDLATDGRVIKLSGHVARYITPQTIADATQKIMRKLEDFFHAHPFRIYVPKLKIHNELQFDTTIWDLALSQLLQEGSVQLVQESLAISGRQIAFNDSQKSLQEQVAKLFQSNMFSPPSREELPTLVHKSGKDLEAVWEFLENEGTLVEVAKNIWFHRQAVAKARELAINTIQAKGELVSADFRDALQSSRKYIIALLEYFDQIGLTVRNGNSRLLKK